MNPQHQRIGITGYVQVGEVGSSSPQPSPPSEGGEGESTNNSGFPVRRVEKDILRYDSPDV